MPTSDPNAGPTGGRVPRWRGYKSLALQPGYPEYRYDNQKASVDLVYHGPFDVCFSKAPVVGTYAIGYGNIPIETVSIKSLPGGKGVLTLHLESITGTPPVRTPPYDAVVEIDWLQLERPVEQAECFAEGGKYALTWRDLAMVQKWEEQPNPEKKAMFIFTDTEQKDHDLPDHPKVLAQKKLKGESTLLKWSPVVRITEQCRGPGLAGETGRVSTTVDGVEADVLPVKFEWLSMIDRYTRTGAQGKWQRQREWAGATSWDRDLYPFDR